MTPDTDTDFLFSPANDPWLTVAEFAEATRVRPVTVRSWVAKGQLKATRSGKRKWLIRRSELDRMLNEESIDDRPPELWEAMYEQYLAGERADSETEYHEAGHRWELALEGSRMAPPDAGFSESASPDRNGSVVVVGRAEAARLSRPRVQLDSGSRFGRDDALS